jgi:hypothetical protein
MKRSLFLAAALVATSFSSAFAGFDEDVTKAYAPYRAALFMSNKKDVEATKKAIGKFLMIWDGQVLATYKDAPARYGAEADWPKTLVDIQAIGQEAQKAAAKGDVAKAHEILEAVRDELDGMRDRNGVRVFSNFVNAYHSEMEHLFRLNVTAETWNDGMRARIREQTGILSYLARDLAAHIPAGLKDNVELAGLVKGLHGSIDALRQALDANKAEGVAKAIKMLKPAYAKLFAKFG